MSVLLRGMRLLASVAGVLFPIFALSALFNDHTDPLSTRIGFAALFLLVGALLLSFGVRVKIAWVPVWLIGWFLSIAAAFQVVFSVYGFNHAASLTEKFAAVFWALVTPMQLDLGLRAIKLARRGSTPKAVDLISSDSRAPILFLRPFESDPKTARIRTGKKLTDLGFNTRTEEELIAKVMNEIGPCVAIGRPDEKLPQLGFNRIYVSDNRQWQDEVLRYMKQAKLVILLIGSSPNFLWEVQKAVELVKPERLLLLIPTQKEFSEFKQLAQNLFRQSLPEPPKNAAFQAATLRGVLYFDPDWAPHYAIPEAPSHFRQALGEKLTSTLKMALRPVYRHLNMNWRQPPLVLPRVLYEATAAGCAVLVLVLIFVRVFGS